MRLLQLSFSKLLAFLCLFVHNASATALTYKLLAHENMCFYIHNEVKNSKVAFYFAVQAGGNFDIDYNVAGPSNSTILSGMKERQGDFVFTALDLGEYSFCFSNAMSTWAEKLVDFEIATENEVKAELPSIQGTPPEHLSSLEESLFKLSGQLSTIARNQKYFRTRENRNFSTVRSTESRIFNFSVMESMMMVTMSGLQVFIVRYFFQGARKVSIGSPLNNAEAYSRLCVNGTCIFFFFLWGSLFVLQQIVLKSMELS